MGHGLGLEFRAGWDFCRGVASGGRHARQAFQQESDERCGWASGRQVNGDPGFQLDDAGGDLDQAEAQGVELGMAPGRPGRQCSTQRPHQPSCAGVQEEPELVGGSGAGRPIGSQVGFHALMWFSA
jgi:hypothetical protein